MLLTIDVGNTNITCGLFSKDECVSTFRITTKTLRTSDEYGILFKELLAEKGYKYEDLKDVIIASVVPNVMHSLENAFLRYYKKPAIVVKPGIRTGIKLSSTNPQEIGADRIVDAVAGYELYGGPVIVIDFGTATTYDYITADGEFSVGITSPGLKISAKALWEDTAKLPEIEIAMPKSVLASDTISSMQVGLVYGCIGQTEYIIKKIKEETGIENINVVATGGLGRIIYEATDSIMYYDPQLTLRGLRLIYEKQKGTKKRM